MAHNPRFHNPFVLAPEAYKRDLRIMQHYVHDTSLYLSLMTGDAFEKTRDFVKASLDKDGIFPFVDPNIQYLERNEYGDRVLKDGTFMEYLNSSIATRQIIAPTLTTYVHPDIEKSWLADILADNIKIRKKAKNEEQEAERKKDYLLQSIKGREQINAKQSNNSLSGAHSSASTPFFNPSSHSTLTSICRSTSGYGNANNEKFLSGNRHYWSAGITKANFISIVGHTDYVKLKAVIEKYDLVYPSVADVMACIEKCSRNYWRSTRDMADLRKLATNCNPLQRAAFLYTGDLYQIRQLNSDFVRTFVNALSVKVSTPVENYPEILSTAQEDHFVHALSLCKEEVKGQSSEAVSGTLEIGGVVASTILSIEKTLTQYADFIDAFMVTNNVPASLANFPSSIRDAALMSDTDSTIFTVQEWVHWHQGEYNMTPEACAVSDTMVFLASATITHVLARMSANLGVITERIFQIAMKNEFKFDVFVPTNNTKHYFALISRKESVIYEKFKEEIKGVHLKSSTISKKIMSLAKELMVKDIMTTVAEGRTIDVRAILKRIGDMERMIYDTISRGDPEFFRFSRINTPDSYKGEDPIKTNYGQYLFWKEVFAPKYGDIAPPPYVCYKSSTDLVTPTKLAEYLVNMEDQELAERMKAFMRKAGRSNLSTIWIPEEVIQSKGVPEEILSAINSRKIVKDNCNVFYLISEVLGVNLPEGMLISDYY